LADEILSLLNELAASHTEINLLNVYKGVPISFTAQIVGFQGMSMKVRTDQRQTVCMFFEKKTFIQSKGLTEIYQAEVTDLDPIDRVATLANFNRVVSGVGNRVLVRVQPKGSLESNVKNQYSDNIVQGELADISQNGLAIYLPLEIFSPRLYCKDASVTVTLRLPGVYEPRPSKTGPSPLGKSTGRLSREIVRFPFVNKPAAKPSEGEANPQSLENPLIGIHGIVVNTYLDQSKGCYRIGMRILEDDPSRAFITQFIAQRQKEIIGEIKAMYDLMIKDVEK